MDFGIQNKVALVTAASRGLGKAVAMELAREGCTVVICSRKPDAIQRAAVELAQATNAKVLALVADVSDGEQVQHVVERFRVQPSGLEQRPMEIVEDLARTYRTMVADFRRLAAKYEDRFPSATIGAAEPRKRRHPIAAPPSKRMTTSATVTTSSTCATEGASCGTTSEASAAATRKRAEDGTLTRRDATRRPHKKSLRFDHSGHN